jgi:hypothetical protein
METAAHQGDEQHQHQPAASCYCPSHRPLECHLPTHRRMPHATQNPYVGAHQRDDSKRERIRSTVQHPYKTEETTRMDSRTTALAPLEIARMSRDARLLKFGYRYRNKHMPMLTQLVKLKREKTKRIKSFGGSAGNGGRTAMTGPSSFQSCPRRVGKIQRPGSQHR